VHEALVSTVGVPAADRFQLLTEHEPGDLIYDAEYLGIARLGVWREDVLINLVEVAKENWSFGLGEATYAEPDEVAA
jgi:4-oxalocrotonate tautomerase